jgi:hypothetical protein
MNDSSIICLLISSVNIFLAPKPVHILLNDLLNTIVNPLFDFFFPTPHWFERASAYSLKSVNESMELTETTTISLLVFFRNHLLFFQSFDIVF